MNKCVSHENKNMLLNYKYDWLNTFSLFLSYKDLGPRTAKLAANGEIGVADQNFEIRNCTIFVICIFRGKPKLCIYNNHSLLIINLHEQQAYTFFFHFSYLNKNLHFWTSVIINISVPSPLEPKNPIYKNHRNARVSNIGSEVWAYVKYENRAS